MKVELLDHMGTDLDVVNAARVSFDKESEWGRPIIKEWEEENHHNGDFVTRREYGHNQLSDKDSKLISYLVKHGHWTPFSHCYAKFRIKAPLFVRSQLFKHKVGLTENEVSRRYVDSEPEFYVPEKWRKRAENVKQGSSDDQVYGYDVLYEGTRCTSGPEAEYEELIEHAQKVYNEMLEGGVCPEQARMVLPQSMYTEWIWSGSLAAFARVFALRTSDHAQWETKQIALQIGELLQPLFPVSWQALTSSNQPKPKEDIYFGA